MTTAIANSYLNNMNQVTPQGSLSYDQTGSQPITDPVTGNTYDIPRFTVSQSAPQQTLDANTESSWAKLALARLGNAEASNLFNKYGNSSIADSLGGAPAMGSTYNLQNMGGPTSSLLSNPGSQQTTFGDAGNITTDYDNSQGTLQRQNVEQALFQRMQPQLDRDRANLEARLSDQGIKYGSPAYQAAMDDYNRQLADQRLAITAQGGQEQQLQANLAAQRAGFQNAAQQQAYTEAQGRGTFANTAQTNAFQQAAAQAQLFNAGQAQTQALYESQFNAQQAARSQYLAEQYQLRNQPINEITALLSGSQVSNPQFATTAQNKIPTTDIAGLINTNFSQNLANYQQQTALSQTLLGGILGAAGIAGGAALKSDRRSKTNIHKIGSVMTAAPQKLAELPVYQYEYKDDPASVQHVGPMAQDVEKIDPAAVAKDKRGTRYIDPRRVMGGILKAA